MGSNMQRQAGSDHEYRSPIGRDRDGRKSGRDQASFVIAKKAGKVE